MMTDSMYLYLVTPGPWRTCMDPRTSPPFFPKSWFHPRFFKTKYCDYVQKIEALLAGWENGASVLDIHTGEIIYEKTDFLSAEQRKELISAAERRKQR